MQKLENISISLNLEEINETFHMKPGADSSQLQDLLNLAKSLIKARAVYKVFHIERKLEEAVMIDGIQFTSHVLRKNLEDVWRVFPYVLTIGPDLEERSRACKDMLERVYLDMIGNLAVKKAREYLEGQLEAKYPFDSMSFMSPGSLKEWPIEEQKPLFSILGNVEEAVGVRLKTSLLMSPTKSISGIYFPTETTFQSCQLCPRKNCVGRRAPYDEKLAREYGIAE